MALDSVCLSGLCRRRCGRNQLPNGRLAVWLDGNRPDTLLLAIAAEVKEPLALIGTFGLVTTTALFFRESSDAAKINPAAGQSALLTSNSANIAREVSMMVSEQGVDVLLEPDNGGEAVDRSTCERDVEFLERENQRLTAEIASAKAAKASFLSTISHELRTPMNGIIGMSELLQASNLSPRENGYVNTIHSSANSLMHSLSDILDYTRISTGELTLENSRFNLPDCVEDVCEMLADAAHQRGNELVCHLDSGLPTMVDGDHNRLRQILNHLVGNAIAFTENGDVVLRLSSIATHGQKHTLQCEISDTGVGIIPEMQIRLFEAFSQADESITRGHEGLGLGLAVSSEVIKAMNGKISFSSRVDEGTSFTFTMDIEEIPGDSKLDIEPMLHGAKVLLVDDNETNRTILNHQLSQWGVITVSAASGKEAIDTLKGAVENGNKFDAMILDMHMPEMDGLSLAKTISSDKTLPNLRTMLLTSAVVDASQEELESIGIEKFISKPARQSLLRTSLMSLLPDVEPRAAIQFNMNPGANVYNPIKASVLLVEDNRISQDVTVGLLESFGCTVEVVGDGRDAVSRCEKNKYDIVFMDCELPTISGFAATSAIRELPSINSKVCIVAVTALAMAGDRERCLQSGMDDYLSKPLHQDQLYATLMRWCANRLDIESDEDADDAIRGVQGINDIDENVEAVQDPETLAIINVAALEAIRGLQRPGKEDLLAKVVGIYFEKSPQLMADIKTCQNDGHLAEITAATHTLKSSSAYVGAEQLAYLCQELESAVADQDGTKMSAITNRMSDAYTDVQDALTQYLDQPRAA